MIPMDNPENNAICGVGYDSATGRIFMSVASTAEHNSRALYSCVQSDVVGVGSNRSSTSDECASPPVVVIEYQG